MASNPYYTNFVPAGAAHTAGAAQAYGASPAPATGQTSYDTAYPNTAAFAVVAKADPTPAGGPGGSGNIHHYQGYEAALYNAAQAYLSQQQGSKGVVPVGQGPAAAAANKKAAKKTRYFNQKWSSSSSQQLHYCETCKISCASAQTYKDHLEGQKHKKREAAARSGVPLVPAPRTGAALHCELCNVTCTSSDAYAAHIRGTKHQKVVKLHTKLGKPIPSSEPQLIHASKPGASVNPATSAAPQASTAPAATSAAPQTASPDKAVVAGTPKINFLGGSYLATASNKQPQTPSQDAVIGPAVYPPAKAAESKEATIPATPPAESNAALLAQLEEEKNIQPVGQDYIDDLRGPDGKLTGYNCRLCDCRFNDVNAKDMHLKGRRHRLMYKKKVDPSLVVENKGWQSKNRLQKEARWQGNRKKPDGSDAYWEGPESYEDEGQVGVSSEEEPLHPGAGHWPRMPLHRPMGGPLLPPPPKVLNIYFPGMNPPMGMPSPQMRRQETFEERHVMTKHAEIYPSEEEISGIQSTVSHVERALKLVSDQLANNGGEAPAQGSSAGDQQQEQSSGQRALKGVMRIGALAKGLLLKGDRFVQLVVLCSQPPTKQLLQTVADALPNHLTAVAQGITFTVSPVVDEAAMEVRAVQGHGLSGELVVKVSLTSPVVREEQLAGGDAREDADQSADRLSTPHCLQALAELRRAKWFQARASTLHNCTVVMRIMRDYHLRSPVFSNMDFWAMELLVERSMSSAGMPLSAAEGMRRVFECLASGILLQPPNGWGPGLSDPCEKDVVDACSSLTDQEVEDITAGAQVVLRELAFRQIYKVLGMSKPLSNPPRYGVAKKRPRDNSQGEAASTDADALGDLKKEKIEGEN
nr:EOG090X037N [Eulimnadia texana]